MRPQKTSTLSASTAVIYQLGDHDPSGVAAWDDIQRKLLDFVDDDIDVTFERIAVTPEQITELGLPTRPTKQSDTRAKKFVGESVEVDAIPSSILRDLIRAAIERWIDPEQLRICRVAEESERTILELNASRGLQPNQAGVNGILLSEHHLAALAASGITPEHAAARAATRPSPTRAGSPS